MKVHLKTIETVLKKVRKIEKIFLWRKIKQIGFFSLIVFLLASSFFRLDVLSVSKLWLLMSVFDLNLH